MDDNAVKGTFRAFQPYNQTFFKKEIRIKALKIYDFFFPEGCWYLAIENICC